MGCRESRLPTLRCSDHCDLAFLIPCPGGQCLCPRRHGLLLGNDPHRRLWHSLSLPGTPPTAIATAIATLFATATLAAALTSITLAIATASLTATTFATTLATTLATTAFATTFASRSHPHPGNCPPQRAHGHHLCRQRAD